MSLSIGSADDPRTLASDKASADRARAWLSHLHELELSPFTPVHAIAAIERAPAATAAAARAAACPDLFVVHAADAALGEPVIVEVARVCAKSERVLVLSPDPAAADRLTERLVKTHGAGVVRALAEDENPVRPLLLVGKSTSIALLAALAEQLPRDSAEKLAAAEHRLRAIERLIELAEQTAKLDREIADLNSRAGDISAEVRSETGTSFAQKRDGLGGDSAAALGRIEGERASLLAARAELLAGLPAIREEQAAAACAKKPGFFARLFGARAHPDAHTLEKQVQSIEAEIAAIESRVAEIRAKAEGVVADLGLAREKAIEEEIAARCATFMPRLVELTARRDRIAAEAAELRRSVPDTPATVEELCVLREVSTRDLLAARDHAAEVTRSPAEFARRSLLESRIVVGTPGSIGTDPVFERRTAVPSSPFDLLILDRAEDLAEPDFLNLSRLARRWVLVGDARAPDPASAQLNGAVRRGQSRNGRPIEPSFASRLAHALDREPWGFEVDRLICRLEFVSTAERASLTREPLLDRPEIELRFVVGKDGEPLLAEVAFPGGTPIAAARSFLFHQLGEVLIRPCGSVQWEHTATAITARWPAVEHGAHSGAGEWIELEPGVREKIVGNGLAGFTAAVAFDLSAGWDADRAAAWLAEHTPEPSSSRFFALPAALPSPRRSPG